ncbi:MAG: hypothetical protein ACRDOY_01070 [Nocardioidaceae bacterium]
MKRTTRLIVGGSMAVAGLAAGAAVAAAATGGSEDATETPISGSALDKASAAALDHLGEGRVTATESGDEESYYEVEVALPSGEEVDVQLDRSFNVVGDDSDTGESDAGEGRG